MCMVNYLLLISKIKSRRMIMAAHCIRYPELSSYPLILWEPTQGKANRGRRRLNYVYVLKKDTGLLEKEEIRTSMLDRDILRELTHTDARVDYQDHHRNLASKQASKYIHKCIKFNKQMLLYP